jgi:cytosine/adenosine deaminase-related metal-dependent hydrolase
VGARCGCAPRAAARRPGAAVGAIAAGCRADSRGLNDDDPALAMQRTADVSTRRFSAPRAIRARRAGRGRFVVRDGRHPYEEMIFERYRKALARLVS